MLALAARHARAQVLEIKSSELDRALQSQNSAEEAHARVDVAQLELDFGHPAIAAEHLVRGIEAAHKAGDRVVELKLQHGLAVTSLHLKRYTEATEQYTRVLAQCDEATDGTLMIRAKLGIAKCKVAVGSVDDGITDYLAGLSFCSLRASFTAAQHWSMRASCTTSPSRRR